MHPNMRLFVFGTLCLTGSPMASAHFNVILPQDYGQWSARRGESVSCRLVWGHGYEHAWIDARTPAELVAISPTGKRTDLMPALKPTEVVAADGKAYGAFAFAYQPQERGDHVLALKAALLWDADDGVFLQDYAKSILHVQDKTGWDRRVGHKFELVALNRPYAMLRGQVIRMLVLYDGKPLPNCEVEIERLSPEAPKASDLPGEEFIVFEARSDPGGVVAFGLHETGWFALTATHESGQEISQDGHKGKLVERATHWICVVAPPPSEKAKN